MGLFLLNACFKSKRKARKTIHIFVFAKSVLFKFLLARNADGKPISLAAHLIYYKNSYKTYSTLNITMDLKEIGWEGVNGTHLVYRESLRALAENILDNWVL